MRAARSDVWPEDLQRLAEAYAHDWCIDGCFDAHELEQSAAVLHRTPDFKNAEAAPISEWADISIVADALHKIGIGHEGHKAAR
jgi:hypothetical protein